MRRILELDALRGLAAVAIVVYHLWFPAYGFMGTAVDLFFVMSGYLITAIIMKQREQPGFLATFYARRSLRIWPIYYLSLFIFLAINPALPKPYPTEGLPYFLTYTQNIPFYWGSDNPPFAHIFSHTWSLAIEEQYYLFWPLALVFLGRRSFVPLAFGLMALSVGARMGGTSKWLLLSRLDGLALGGVLAAMFGAMESGRTSPGSLKKTLAAVGVGSVAYLAAGGTLVRLVAPAWPAAGDPLVALSLRMFAVNLMYFSLIGLLVLHAGHVRLAWLRDARLVELGQMSYGIYLYHLLVFCVVQDLADRLGISSRPAIDGAKLAGSLALAAASWRLVERPLLSLKDRVGYRAPQAAPAPRVLAESPRLDTLRSGA